MGQKIFSRCGRPRISGPKCPRPISLVEQRFQSRRGKPRKSEATIPGQSLEYKLENFTQGENQSVWKDESEVRSKGIDFIWKKM